MRFSHAHAFTAMALVLLMGCAPKPTSVFKESELAYFRGLFRPTGEVGWPTRGMMGKAEREAAAITSFRTHSSEVLPILVRGWEEGLAFPLPEEKPLRMPIPPMHEDILHLIICLDPAAAETMLVKKVRSHERMDAFNMSRDMLISILYWRLHSKQSMGLFKELIAENPDYRFLFVVYCAQENDRAGLADAKVLLRANKGQRYSLEAALREAAVYQLEGNTKALKEMYIRCPDCPEALYPLWGLVFMGRKDVVSGLAGARYVNDMAFPVLKATEKWEHDKSRPPCESGPVKGLLEMAVVNQYTPHRPVG